MRVDLHCHTTASDGRLEPAALLAQARDTGVDMLSITDHDTTAAYPGLAVPRDVRLVPGVEFSSQWRSTGIHILGLNVNLASGVLAEGISRQRRLRVERAGRIAERLRRKGLPDLLPRVLEVAGPAAPGRPHFARCLVEAGIARDPAQAFKKFLGVGRPAYVPPGWASPNEIIDWIQSAGGSPVLAHPAKYGLTRTKLGVLLEEFRAEGGVGMEVVCGSQTADLTRDLARLCVERGLLASCGSDFHEAAPGRTPLGLAAPLPEGCRPIWESW